MKKNSTFIFITSLYSILTLLFLYPLFLNFKGLAGHGDAWQFVWNIWWVKQVITQGGLDLFYTNYLHWPGGINLILQTLTLANSLPAVFLSLIFGFVGAYNLLVIAHFILAGIGMYILCRYLTGNDLASFIAGAVFAFSPYHLVHYYGHLHLLSLWVLPFSIYFLLRTLDGYKWGFLGAGIFYALTAYTDLYYFLFLFLASVFILLWNFSKIKVVFGKLVLVVLITAILVSPYLLPFAYNVKYNSDLYVLGHNPASNFNTVSSLFIPGGRSFYGFMTADSWKHIPGWRENGSYLGYAILILLIFGFLKNYKEPKWWLWFCLGSGFLILTFPGPYFWLESILPFLKIAGVPIRFFAITSMSLAVLASFSLAKLSPLKRGQLVAVLFLVFILFEYLPAPVEVSKVQISSFYYELGNDQEKYAIIDVSDDNAKVLFYQTVHGKPLIGGYTTRPTNSSNVFLEKTPVINDLLIGNRLFANTQPPKNARETLKNLKVK